MKLFDAANQYCKESDWKTLAMIKFCLCSMGVIIGVLLPQSVKTAALTIAAVVFVITYVPLMIRLFKVFKRM